MGAGVVVDSPVGPLTLEADGAGRLCGVWFGARPGRPATTTVAVLTAAAAQLEEYFVSSRRSFDLPLAPVGTPWQLAVWRELVAVPYATTVTYGELARRLGRPAASRAVGAANGANPLSIVVPCHRVIGTGGRLTGYGGGLANKRRLLDLEASGAVGGQGRLLIG